MLRVRPHKKAHEPITLESVNAKASATRIRGFISYAVIAIAILIFTSSLNHQQDKTNTLLHQNIKLTQQNAQATRQARTLARQIQEQRVKGIRDTCERDNAHHRDTLKRLDKLLAEAIKDGKLTKAEAQKARGQNAFLISGLAPLKNCDKEVALATGKTHRP